MTRELFEPDRMDVNAVLDHLDDDVRTAPLWPVTLADLVDVLADHLESRKGLDFDAAMKDAQDLIVVISHYLGGRSIYLPRDDRIKRAIRDAAIYRAFDGTNHRELAHRARLTPAQIYNIIGRQRSLRKKGNGDLPPA